MMKKEVKNQARTKLKNYRFPQPGSFKHRKPSGYHLIYVKDGAIPSLPIFKTLQVIVG